MKFGDIIENSYQPAPNPFRFYIYINSFYRNGMCNPGKHVKVIGRDHKISEFKEEDILKVIGNIFENKDLLDMFNVPVKELLKEFNNLYSNKE